MTKGRQALEHSLRLTRIEAKPCLTSPTKVSRVPHILASRFALWFVSLKIWLTDVY